MAATRTAVFAAAAVAFWLAHWNLGVWSIDDAGITYAYAISLADRGSLSPLSESMPVEGYSNPLLFLLVALLRWLHLFDPITTHTKIELLAFALMVVLVHELLRAHLARSAALIGTGVFVVLELLTPSTWLWYSSGLENVIVSLALVTLMFIADRARRLETFNPIGVGILGFAVALVRPEAPVYVAVFYVTLLVYARPRESSMRRHVLRFGIAGTITAALYVGFLLWRHANYGVWLPNTYYAKLGSGSTLLANITDYVIAGIFRYNSSLLFALAAVALALIKPLRTYAVLVCVFTVASLVMPVVGGDDWMGEYRFATPFLAMSHVAGASFLAAMIATHNRVDDVTTRRLLFALMTIPVIVFTVVGVVSEPTVNNVTTARVLEKHGVQRMQHQRRLGLINPVVIAPDAGGLLLFGAMQHIDNGYLTDFQMAHMTRDLRVMTQYQTVERIADLADTNPNWAVSFDRSLVGSRFLSPRDQHMFARRELVELDTPPAAASFYEQDGIRLHLSPDNVLTAVPGGLVRIELTIAWVDVKTSVLRPLELFASIAHDNDKISLIPYGDLETVDASGTQRKALLLRAPAEPGHHDVVVEVRRRGETEWSRTLFQIEVVPGSGMQAVVDALLSAPDASPDLVMRRFAWLREQSIPRLAQQTMRKFQSELVTADNTHARRAGTLVKKLTWDARLAALTDEVPAPIRAAEQAVIERVVRASACERIADVARQSLCIGRLVDRLRRYGYFGVLGRVPPLRAAVENIEHQLSELDPSQQYVALVGLSLATPENVSLQKKLVDARDYFAKQAAWPALDP